MLLENSYILDIITVFFPFELLSYCVYSTQSIISKLHCSIQMTTIITISDGTAYHGTPFFSSSKIFFFSSLGPLKDLGDYLISIDKTSTFSSIANSTELHNLALVRSLTFIPSLFTCNEFYVSLFSISHQIHSTSQHTHSTVDHNFSKASLEIDHNISNLSCNFEEFIQSEISNFCLPKSSLSPYGIVLHLDARLASAIVFEYSRSRRFRCGFNKWLSKNIHQFTIAPSITRRNRLRLLLFILHEPLRQPINYSW